MGVLVAPQNNAPSAEQNAQFVLHVLHWLSGVL
jgi:hypothetical protein